MVSTWDFDSRDPSSILGGAFICYKHLIYIQIFIKKCYLSE